MYLLENVRAEERHDDDGDGQGEVREQLSLTGVQVGAASRGQAMVTHKIHLNQNLNHDNNFIPSPESLL